MSSPIQCWRKCRFKLALTATAVASLTLPRPKSMLYEHDFQGRSFAPQLDNLRHTDDRASCWACAANAGNLRTAASVADASCCDPGAIRPLTEIGLNDLEFLRLRSVPKNARIDERSLPPAPVVAKIFYRKSGLCRTVSRPTTVLNFQELERPELPRPSSQMS
jgi:hypothetical protein